MTKTALTAALFFALTGAASAYPYQASPVRSVASSRTTNTINYANGSRSVTTFQNGMLNGNAASRMTTQQIAPGGRITSTRVMDNVRTPGGGSTTSFYGGPSSPGAVKTISSTPNNITLNYNNGGRTVTTFEKGLLNGQPTSRMTTQQISANGRITSQRIMDNTTTKAGTTTTFSGK